MRTAVQSREIARSKVVKRKCTVVQTLARSLQVCTICIWMYGLAWVDGYVHVSNCGTVHAVVKDSINRFAASLFSRHAQVSLRICDRIPYTTCVPCACPVSRGEVQLSLGNTVAARPLGGVGSSMVLFDYSTLYAHTMHTTSSPSRSASPSVGGGGGDFCSYCASRRRCTRAANVVSIGIASYMAR
jgi:hypothetical protein